MTCNAVVRLSLTLLVGAGCLISTVGCESKAGTGALIGGGGGALAGGLIGSASHARAGEGALIGGAIGAIGGALVGHAADERDRRDDQARDSYNYHATREYDRRHDAARCSQQDVIDWSARGTRDDIIIDRVERSGTVFKLTAADENKLRDRGVSEDVIRAMKDTARRAG